MVALTKPCSDKPTKEHTKEHKKEALLKQLHSREKEIQKLKAVNKAL